MADVTPVYLAVLTCALLGASLLFCAASVAICVIWWWALGRWRKCLYETYLLADLQRWASAHARKESDDNA